MFRSLLIIALLALTLTSEATHIVGGQIYYSRTGTNTYQITLNLYVDCFNGSGAAIDSDRESVIGIYDLSNNNRLRDKFYLHNPTEKEVSKLNYNCVKPMRDQCVTEFTFVRTITLPPNQDGYIISYQRCCRNAIISNIVQPGDQGTTYWTKIPGTNTIDRNNAAYFKNLPPNFLCINAPMVFDHSAIDPDDDSLIYELYTPFIGGANQGDQIKPDPPSAPPYSTVTWRTGYAVNKQLDGNPTITIDRYTGQLTTTPTKTGQFVVGIKVLEYRNGILIGETMRDFQFYVRQCDFEVVAAFSTPTYNCDKTVQFTNLSQKATNFRWDFGDPSTNADTSRLETPSYTYPRDGDYFATLRVWTDQCEDVYSVVVRVKSEIDIPLPPDTAFCGPFSLDLDVQNARATGIRWSNGAFGRRTTVKDPGWTWAEVSYGNCVKRDSFFVKIDTFSIQLPPDQIFCDSVDGSIQIPSNVQGLKRVQWENNPAYNGMSFPVNRPGVYTVQAWNEHCTVFDTIEVFASSRPDIGDSLFFCNEFELELDGGPHRDARYLWQDGSTNRFFTARSKGLFWVEVRQRQCVSRDTLLINNPVIDLELGANQHFCDTVYKELSAPPGMASYLWSTDSEEPEITVSYPGTFWVLVKDTNDCEKSDTVVLTMTASPVIDLGNDTSICQRTRAVYTTDRPFSRYIWSDGGSGRENSFEEAGIYWLKVIDEYACSGSDTVQVSIDPDALPNELFIPNAFTPNGDNLNEKFPFGIEVNQPEYRVRVWNRWGELVFDSEQSTSQYWDGTYRGSRKGQPEAFMYLVEYRGCDGDKRRDSGTVTVLH